MISKRFRFTHWLRIDPENEKLQWEKLKEYNDNHDCSMTVFYYDYNPLTDKVIKLDCNQSFEELELDVDSEAKGSFKKIKAKPTNSTPYNKSFYSFFEENLGIKVESTNSKYKDQQIPVNTLEEFSKLENVEVLDELLKRNNWQLVKIKSDRGFKYQLYFGEGKQVDNRFEYGYAKFQFKSRIMDRLQRLINYEIKNSEINLNKFIGRKLNSFGAKYELINGDRICIDAKCVGVVLGISDGNLDLFDINRPIKEKYYSIDLDEFEKGLKKGFYKPNYNMLCNYEKLEIRKYLKNKVDKFNELCGDWDYRNIDMTDSHLQGINIKKGLIETFCEKYSTALDEYVMCDSEVLDNKKLINDFNLLDLSNMEHVLDFMREIESHIDFNNVDKILNDEEQNQQKEDIEMEMEY